VRQQSHFMVMASSQDKLSAKRSWREPRRRPRDIALQNLMELSGGLYERSAVVSLTSRSNLRYAEVLKNLYLLRLALWAQPRSASGQQTLRLRERFIQHARVFAAAPGVVGFAAAFAAHDRCDGLNDFARLNLRGVFR
jgi:hypothetical protein